MSGNFDRNHQQFSTGICSPSKAFVMPTELSQLRDFECYIKYPGDYSCTKLETSRQNPPSTKKEAFILKPEKKRVYTLSKPKVSQEKREGLV